MDWPDQDLSSAAVFGVEWQPGDRKTVRTRTPPPEGRAKPRAERSRGRRQQKQAPGPYPASGSLAVRSSCHEMRSGGRPGTPRPDLPAPDRSDSAKLRCRPTARSLCPRRRRRDLRSGLRRWAAPRGTRRKSRLTPPSSTLPGLLPGESRRLLPIRLAVRCSLNHPPLAGSPPFPGVPIGPRKLLGKTCSPARRHQTDPALAGKPAAPLAAGCETEPAPGSDLTIIARETGSWQPGGPGS